MKAWHYILAVIIGVAIGCAVGYDTADRQFSQSTETARTDTVFVHDTVEIEKPVLKDKKIVETMYVAVHDTIVKNDTTFIALPRESRTYGDERYTAVVSGYKPSLDRLDIYVENQTVTKYLIPEPTKPKMNSLSVGIEAGYLNTFYIPARVKYTRSINSWFAVYGYGQYDLLSRQFGGGMGGEFKLNW
ncbi:MAG: hypothetical protein IKZ08_06000 [Bacteroidales bacterium]|nr:hypothetical protein [Bacteroidales bacterium]